MNVLKSNTKSESNFCSFVIKNNSRARTRETVQVNHVLLFTVVTHLYVFLMSTLLIGKYCFNGHVSCITAFVQYFTFHAWARYHNDVDAYVTMVTVWQASTDDMSKCLQRLSKWSKLLNFNTIFENHHEKCIRISTNM